MLAVRNRCIKGRGSNHGSDSTGGHGSMVAVIVVAVQIGVAADPEVDVVVAFMVDRLNLQTPAITMRRFQVHPSLYQ